MKIALVEYKCMHIQPQSIVQLDEEEDEAPHV